MKVWIFDEGTQLGPFSLSDLAERNITEDTKIWCAGMDKWAPAGTVEELRSLFDGSFVADSEENTTEEEVVITHEKVNEVAEEPTGEPVEQEDEEYSEPENVPPLAPPFIPPYFNRPPTPAERLPENYLAWSIILTLLCCSPLALAALVGSIVTSNRVSKGNLKGAKCASEFTAWMIMLNIALGILPSLLLTLFL